MDALDAALDACKPSAISRRIVGKRAGIDVGDSSGADSSEEAFVSDDGERSPSCSDDGVDIGAPPPAPLPPPAAAVVPPGPSAPVKSFFHAKLGVQKVQLPGAPGRRRAKCNACGLAIENADVRSPEPSQLSLISLPRSMLLLLLPLIPPSSSSSNGRSCRSASSDVE